MQGLETRESGASAVADMAGALFLVAEGGNDGKEHPEVPRPKDKLLKKSINPQSVSSQPCKCQKPGFS